MSRFPFPMPFGWFKVAMPGEVPAGQIVTKRFFGTELVLWRAPDGSLACQEAYCPHLGASMAVGGRLEDGCIQCPFHGWRFDANGWNVRISYASHPNRRARMRTFPVREHAGIVFAWYHPYEEAPKWELLAVPEHDDPDFAPYEVHEFTIKTCLQELGENGFDHAHFEFVHSHPKVGDTQSVVFDGFDRTVLTAQQFPSSKGPVDARIDVFGRGPGMAITRYQGLIDAALIGTSTPIDDETVHLSFHFAVKNRGGDDHVDRVAQAFVRSVVNEVGQDVPIWEHKRYEPTPSLTSTEKPILDWRRWFAQFYV
jgi:phenylpropionate dioxygenase-like ring-hydroxylating dioxygenase large terminal subunit